MLDTIPDRITHDATTLTIVWRDGRECRYNLLELRRNCPCATCRGGHGVDAVRVTGGITKIGLNSWKKVGRYALQFLWSDNHDTGIYPYDGLRQLCEADS
jgi:DUF971 family protein